MKEGPVFAVVGPSGAGKDTLLAEVLRHRPDLHLVRRVITRPDTRGGEPFEGVTEMEFARRRAAGDFALDWDAHGLSYGIPGSAQDAAAKGRTVLFNGSRAVLKRAQRLFPTLSVILVTASPRILADRLKSRGRESHADIVARLARASYEVPDGLPVFRVVNEGPLDDAVQTMLSILQPVRA